MYFFLGEAPVLPGCIHYFTTEQHTFELNACTSFMQNGAEESFLGPVHYSELTRFRDVDLFLTGTHSEDLGLFPRPWLLWHVDVDCMWHAHSAFLASRGLIEPRQVSLVDGSWHGLVWLRAAN